MTEATFAFGEVEVEELPIRWDDAYVVSTRSASARPRSFRSATPARCADPSWSPSPSPTSTITPGPLFTRVYDPHPPRPAHRQHHHPHAARPRRGRRTSAARITARFLRAGHTTTAALAGVPLERIAAQTRHRDISVLVDRYLRPLDALATTSSHHLGL